MNKSAKYPEGSSSRRSFLHASAASGLLYLEPQTVFGAQANSALEIGIIGCGGRGEYIGNFFVENTGARVVALADPLQDRLDSIRVNLHCPSARSYTGVDGYRGLLDSKVDAVLIESPPYFHPEQVSAAIESGKHVFMAKPVAIDVPGCHIISESARKAQGRLSLMVDFQTRARPVYQEAAARVRKGDIGTPVMAQVYYHAGDHIAYTGTEYRATTHVQDSPLQGHLRRWGQDVNLSGDIIVEQDIHMIDVANWFIGEHPLAARGTGGRKAGTRGNFFILEYTYPNGVKTDFSSSSFSHGYRDLCVRLYGTKGTVDSHYMGAINIYGANAWKGTESDQTRLGALANVQNFVAGIRSGQYVVNAEDAVESALSAVLGRMAAYRGTNMTWEEMLQLNEKLEPRLEA
jgi:predicted dehydrogenase